MSTGVAEAQEVEQVVYLCMIMCIVYECPVALYGETTCH